ncbi:DUF2076 domain-containing protein [Buchnera aphidicola (Thelaxes californica)]|uniref:DUF2076 domain-containing protein n=1 Tax=Buchnera aphidicola (Thelaxes californica) TaxID=1315998 RepID=A0A4D6YL43_9GAMM|nr:DUF2076 domain-containing protein [Buchnera aphidicola]QCI26694.1 DUF2076 domain-containing protein [Buchnera aphidicola (Thelaxes californica)]
MQFEEKKIIENLFERLKNVEEKCPEKNTLANNFINECIQKNPNSIYYIIQTVLIQEDVIKKLNERIIALENDISLFKKNNNIQEPSFLKNTENAIKSTQKLDTKKNQNTISKNYDSAFYEQKNPMNKGCNSSISSGGVSSFLGSAAQTAAGVAGGIFMGNILNNLFHSDKEISTPIDINNQNDLSKISNTDSIKKVNDDFLSEEDKIQNNENKNLDHDYENNHEEANNEYDEYDDEDEDDDDYYENHDDNMLDIDNQGDELL